ncbi:MAG TPA: transglycosylase SLT domain-containing protein [Burkholderiales bacterium]|nr:transglycosylase SLT domain-containing protein [Burkholderiales bacterium]
MQARAYEHGEGVAKDPIRAVELYCRAAAQGNADAQYDLGWIYANGRGVMRRETLAASLFELAAEQGHPQARAMLEHLPPPDGELPECMRSQPVVEYDDSVVVLSQEAPPSDEPTFAANSEAEQRIIDLVKVLAPEYKVSPLLALAIIRAESNFDASARSPKNAQGLMQLIPETSARFKVRKPYDPVQNLRGGLAYLRWLLAYFRGDVALVAAAYNAGERAVERYRGIPPYAETREYVRRILSTFRRRDHPFDPAASEPSPELSRIVLSTSH